MTIQTDALIVGAGPCGLFQVFELGLLGLNAHIVDPLPQTGGQCSELYPDKPIYDIPALPKVLARDLVTQLEEQIAPFSPTIHLNEVVTDVERHDDTGRFTVRTDKGKEFDAGVVIIAGGVGAFEHRRMRVDGASDWEGTAIHYAIKDRTKFAGKDLLILGGGDSALDWTLDLLDSAASVTLVHRSRVFRAQPASVDQMFAACEESRMMFLEGTPAGLTVEDGALTGVTIRGKDRIVRNLECDQVLCFWGMSPKLGPIGGWGLELHKKSQVIVDTEKFQSNIPGLYAVGDINWYPGKKKLILSGFHEAALAAFAAKAYMFPGEKVHLQYTTTSTKMHQRLGVSNPYTEKDIASSAPVD